MDIIDGSLFHEDITFNNLEKCYRKIFSKYAFMELSYHHDKKTIVITYILEMDRLHKLIYDKWTKISSEDQKADLIIMSETLGELIDIAKSHWINL